MVKVPQLFPTWQIGRWRRILLVASRSWRRFALSLASPRARVCQPCLRLEPLPPGNLLLFNGLSKYEHRAQFVCCTFLFCVSSCRRCFFLIFFCLFVLRLFCIVCCQESGCKHVTINCLETYAPRVLFEQVLNSLSDCKPSPENLYGGLTRCDSTHKFIRHLRSICDQQEVCVCVCVCVRVCVCGKDSMVQRCIHLACCYAFQDRDRKIVIVLDNCERLRQFRSQDLAIFLRLRELVCLALCLTPPAVCT